MLPAQIIAAQMLQGASSSPSLFSATSSSPPPSTSLLAAATNATTPFSSPERSCAARTIGHSARLFAELGLPPEQNIAYAHRRSDAAAAALQACCAPNPVGFVAGFCVVWCEIPDVFLAQMLTSDGEFIAWPFTSCLEHAYLSSSESESRGGTGNGNGNGTEGGGAEGETKEVSEDADAADAAFGTIAVHRAEVPVTSGAAAAARPGGPPLVRTRRMLALGAFVLAVPYVLALA